MGVLIKDTTSSPDRSFVKHILSGFQGEILRPEHSPESPVVSVIIPTRDAYGKGYFPLLLEQLKRQTAWNESELIVVKRDTRQGRAINVGVALARGRYIITMDDDESLGDTRVIERLLEVMEKDHTIGMAGGRNVIPPNAPFLVRRAMKEIPRRSTPQVEAITDSDMAEHGLLMMRKEVFTKVGGENELIPRGLDPYLRREFRGAGYRVVVVPGANYSHSPPNNLTKLIKQFYCNGKQAAFCNRFYPQWVFETPDTHMSVFVERRTFAYRAARYLVNMVMRAFKGHLIYVTVSLAYAVGFIMGYVCYRDETQA
jgi:glycosyltransferase involved in cell wall biosynthesis